MSDAPNIFEGNFAAAETGVFWDVEDIKVPNELNPSEVLDKIRLKLSSSGHHGTVSIRVYGDLKDEEFPGGITLNQTPTGYRYARHTKILEDIVAWAAQHPEPSTLMLIIGDNTSDDFTKVVELLTSKKKYQFLLVTC